MLEPTFEVAMVLLSAEMPVLVALSVLLCKLDSGLLVLSNLLLDEETALLIGMDDVPDDVYRDIVLVGWLDEVRLVVVVEELDEMYGLEALLACVESLLGIHIESVTAEDEPKDVP